MKKALAAALTILALSSAASAATFTAEGDTAYMNGEIGLADGLHFYSFLSKHPRIREMVVTSNGGVVVASMRIARLVAEHGIAVRAVHQCDSGCAYIWIASARRSTDVPVQWHEPSAGPGHDRAMQSTKKFLYDFGQPQIWKKLNSGAVLFDIRSMAN